MEDRGVEEEEAVSTWWLSRLRALFVRMSGEWSGGVMRGNGRRGGRGRGRRGGKGRGGREERKEE